MQTSFPKGKIEAVLLEGVHQNAVDAFEGDGLRVHHQKGAAEDAQLADLLRSAHMVGIRSKTQVRGAPLESAERLLAIGCFCIGTNQVDLDAAAARGIPVFNAPFSNTRSVAELTIAEVVMLQRRVFERSSQMHAGRWVKSASGSREVRSKTLGIVGYGHIGSQVSVLAESMGLRVIAFDTAAKLPMGNARLVGSLAELLAESDIVSLHVPATDSTRGMIGAAQIAAMKPGACLINNARGSVVDLDALSAALREGKLSGAAIDVFPREPSGRDTDFETALAGIGNVILTPHVAGSTEEAQAAIAEEVSGKLLKFLNTGATGGAVNVPEVDLPEQGTIGGERVHRILHFHRNVPGVLSQINNAVSEIGANVSSQTLRTAGEIGYAVLDVNAGDAEDVRRRMDGIGETIRTRVLW
ncbi:MAG: phosphoglycerate dehydrogenase [Planctomycetota bacterium]